MPADSMDVVLVAALAENRVIGSDGAMPWHYPADLQRFKRLTTGHPVIMGRKTYESIAGRLDGPLPDRTNIVLTSDPDRLPDHDAIVPVTSIEDALEAALDVVESGAAHSSTAFVIGGGTVYEQFLPHADRLELTEIHASHQGDTRFPEFGADEWREVEREQHDDFDFVTYERR